MNRRASLLPQPPNAQFRRSKTNPKTITSYHGRRKFVLTKNSKTAYSLCIAVQASILIAPFFMVAAPQTWRLVHRFAPRDEQIDVTLENGVPIDQPIHPTRAALSF